MQRIGHYMLERELTALPGDLAFAATHVVLPRHARIAVPEQPVPALGQRIVREACILEALQHPGIPRVFECGVLADRRPWIAVELVEGQTLGERIAALSMPVVEVLALLRDASDILHHAHSRGIVHGHLGGRAVVFRDGSDDVCIVDWTNARLHDSPSAPGAVADRIYRAPEQLRGEHVDGAADIYALGVLAHQALSRGLLTSRRCAMTTALTDLVDRMLDDEPAERPAAADVRAEVLSLLELAAIPDADTDDGAAATPLDVSDLEVAELVELVEVPAISARGTLPPFNAPALPSIPATPNRAIAWTPAHGYAPAEPDTTGRPNLPTRRRV